MRGLLSRTLVSSRPVHAVTFVDNHDTQPGQSLQSWVDGWFKEHAYAVILLRSEGLPCVFYGDLYGIPSCGINPVGGGLEKMLDVRRRLAYGEQIDYFDDADIVGWTRLGDGDHPGSGIAVLLTDGPGGSKVMSVGADMAGAVFADSLGHRNERITIGEDGRAEFFVNGGSVSVWVKQD